MRPPPHFSSLSYAVVMVAIGLASREIIVGSLYFSISLGCSIKIRIKRLIFSLNRYENIPVTVVKFT